MSIYRTLRSLLPRELRPRPNVPKALLSAVGYYRFRTRVAAEGEPVPDVELYQPLFSPWEGLQPFRTHYERARQYTLVTPDRCWVLQDCVKQASRLTGDFAEFGVFRGGTALLTACLLADNGDIRPFHLFDSFAGMPQTSKAECYNPGDFNQTSAEHVKTLLAPTGINLQMHVGFIPDTFATANIDRLAFAHVDVDLYQSILDCVDYIYPRLVPGGILLFDDYGNPSCARAREATDAAFANRREHPIYLPTGQALVIKLPDSGSQSQ